MSKDNNLSNNLQFMYLKRYVQQMEITFEGYFKQLEIRIAKLENKIKEIKK